MKLRELEEAIEGCRRCRLGEGRKKTVPGEGPADAKFMFIGEAPGRREDETGRPFVGRSGKLLRESMRKAGLDPGDCFITSPIKCRPPKNRKPRKDELEACRPWLEKQIEVVDPSVVVLLGNFATKALLEKTGVTKLHGEWEKRGGRLFFVTFHPAAVLRGMVKREEYVRDLEKARKLGERRG